MDIDRREHTANLLKSLRPACILNQDLAWLREYENNGLPPREVRRVARKSKYATLSSSGLVYPAESSRGGDPRKPRDTGHK